MGLDRLIPTLYRGETGNMKVLRSRNQTVHGYLYFEVAL